MNVNDHVTVPAQPISVAALAEALHADLIAPMRTSAPPMTPIPTYVCESCGSSSCTVYCLDETIY